MAKHHPSRITSIIGTYAMSTEVERTQGRQWYPAAHDIAADLSRDYPIGVITAAGVIAALSPNNKWSRNCADARKLISTYSEHGGHAASQVTVCTYGVNLAKALAILKLQHPTMDDIEAVLNGRKVVSFFRCILGNQQEVCVDGHAYSVWAGETITTNKTPKISPTLYDRIADDYREAADLINYHHGSPGREIMEPAHLQAITWITHRRLRGIS
jgi:hypothetical protein